MFPFHYRSIGQQLVGELHHRIINNDESIIILGPRYGGKRYVMARLQALLKQSDFEPVVSFRLLSEDRISTADRVNQRMLAAIQAADKGLELGPDADPFEALKRLADSKSKPVVLLASNVDGMSHHLARKFLQETRNLVEQRKLIAIMSCESDFRELVYDNSDFDCASQYVLTGFTLEQFSEFLRQQMTFLRTQFSEFDKAARHLWQLTGGNIFILRIIIWSIIQERARQNISPDLPLRVDEVPAALKLVGVTGAFGAHMFRHATQSIGRDENSWKQLEQLIAGDRISTLPYDPPCRLELAGIATREVKDDGAELRFSSPIMKVFVESFYTARRFGDLYAGIGNWSQAFECYSRIPREERMRPLSVDDRAEVESTISVLCFSLYAQVAGQDGNDTDILRVEALKRFFAKGCYLVLGFREITFWQRDNLTASPGWKLQPVDGFHPVEEALESIQQMLPKPEQRNLSAGIIESDHPLRKFAVMAVLPSRLNKQLIVVVSDITGVGVVSHERRGLVIQLLNQFLGAYRHGVDVENLQTRHRIGRHHDAIIDSLFDMLGSRELPVQNLLATAATGLRRLNYYSRVLFCLVDEARENIVGIWDDSDDPSVDVAALTKWPLKNPTADLQPYVVKTRQPKIVRDARTDPLANRSVVRAAGMQAEAIVPILNLDGDAIGTIHVERADGAVPTNEEVDDLKFFGRHLAIAIAQCKRWNEYEDLKIDRLSMEFLKLPADAVDTDSAIKKILEAMQRLGHKWARMYFAQKQDGDELFVSRQWFGPATAGADTEFNHGKTVLAARSTGHWDWRCIEEERPILFGWNEKLKNGENYTTGAGLPIINWKHPDQPREIEKHPGDFWVDFPLIHGAQVLGKICLQFDENFRSGQFKLLRLLSGHFSATLAGNLQRDEEKHLRELMLKRSVGDKTAAVLGHNLGTRLGSLPIILDRYRRKARKYPDLEPLNNRLHELITLAQAAARRGNLISPLRPLLELRDLDGTIKEILKLHLKEGSYTYQREGPIPFVEIDRHLFETSLLELIQNSRDAALDSSAMHISIRLETMCGIPEAAIFYRDNGPGVPEDYREKIFEDFFSHRPTQRIPSSGLGMGFIRRAFEAHGGTISYTGQIRSSAPPGAEFTMTLPLPNNAENKEKEDVQDSNRGG